MGRKENMNWKTLNLLLNKFVLNQIWFQKHKNQIPFDKTAFSIVNKENTFIEHPVFEKLTFDHLWKKEYYLQLFGQNNQGRLYIDGDLHDEIEDMQVKSFELFEALKQELAKSIESALFTYYSEVVEEYRDRYGIDADEHAPLINNADEIKNLVQFEAICLPYNFDEDELVVGILFESRWEIEHGTGVKIVNGVVSEVGYQNIVI
jgi:hypothetical protein